MDAKLEAVSSVDIDDNGTFKYILIKLHTDDDKFKYIVRGYDRHEYHGKYNPCHYLYICFVSYSRNHFVYFVMNDKQI